MEVILIRDVDRIGKAGSVIKVKDGYARNFLFPNNLAVPATSGNLKKVEQDNLKRNLKLEQQKKDAEAVKEKLANFSLTMPVLTQEDETLYGSVTNIEIERLLKDEGFDIDKSAIILEQPIKALGIYEIPVKLHPEVVAKIKLWIVKK